MKLIGFSATYSPDSEKNTNKHNYFMNGIVKEVISENCCADICEISNMRNLFAVADGSKSERQGSNAAFLCMDTLNNVFGADFQTAYKRYFSEANRVVQSRSFHANGAKMHTDVGVIYAYRDWIRAYNFGDVFIYHKNEDGLKKISGDAPKTIEVDKVVKKNDELTVKKKVRNNTPYIGHISEDLSVIPYISQPIRLKKNDSVIIATESVVSVLGKNGIIEILNDDNILLENKLTDVIKAAIDKNPQGNYTVVMLTEKPRKPINKLKVSMMAIIFTVLVSIFCVFALPKIGDAYDWFIANLIKRMYLIDDRPDLMPWTPMQFEKVQNQKQEVEVPEKTEPEKSDTETKKPTGANAVSQETVKPASKPTEIKPVTAPANNNSETTDEGANAEPDIPADSTLIEENPPVVQETPMPTESPDEGSSDESANIVIMPGVQTTIDKNIDDILNAW